MLVASEDVISCFEGSRLRSSAGGLSNVVEQSVFGKPIKSEAKTAQEAMASRQLWCNTPTACRPRSWRSAYEQQGQHHQQEHQPNVSVEDNDDGLSEDGGEINVLTRLVVKKIDEYAAKYG